jgi:integrase
MTFGTGEYAEPEEWDKKRQRVKVNLPGRHDLVKLDRRLEKWEKAVNDTYRTYKFDLSPTDFRKEIFYYVGVEQRPGELPKEFLPYLEHYIKEQKQQPNKTKSSWGKFASLLNRLREFSEETGYEITFENIDWSFKDAFGKWLYAPPRNYSINTASKMFESLRRIMKHARLRKVHDNRICEDRDFGIKRVKTKNKVRFTVAEIRKIESHNFRDDPRLDSVRDLLVFACWTGLRISDWERVGRENIREIDGAEYIELVMKKTKGPVFIPIVPPVSRILDKYDYELPKMEEPTFNKLVKVMCKEVLPDARFTRIYSQGGRRLEEVGYKWKSVTSHAGRRSFATNIYEVTKSAYPVMLITGHESERNFFTYIDMKGEEAAQLLHTPMLELYNGQR